MTEKVEHTELPWSVWVEPIADADQAKKELGLLVEGTPDFRPHLVYLCGPNNLAPAVTGCGEKSIANAEYIVLACNSYPALLAERDRLREALKSFANAADVLDRWGISQEEWFSVNDSAQQPKIIFPAKIVRLARTALKDTNQ